MSANTWYSSASSNIQAQAGGCIQSPFIANMKNVHKLPHQKRIKDIGLGGFAFSSNSVYSPLQPRRPLTASLMHRPTTAEAERVLRKLRTKRPVSAKSQYCSVILLHAASSNTTQNKHTEQSTLVDGKRHRFHFNFRIAYSSHQSLLLFRSQLQDLLHKRFQHTRDFSFSRREGAGCCVIIPVNQERELRASEVADNSVVYLVPRSSKIVTATISSETDTGHGSYNHQASPPQIARQVYCGNDDARKVHRGAARRRPQSVPNSSTHQRAIRQSQRTPHILTRTPHTLSRTTFTTSPLQRPPHGMLHVHSSAHTTAAAASTTSAAAAAAGSSSSNAPSPMPTTAGTTAMTLLEFSMHYDRQKAIDQIKEQVVADARAEAMATARRLDSRRAEVKRRAENAYTRRRELEW